MDVIYTYVIVCITCQLYRYICILYAWYIYIYTYQKKGIDIAKRQIYIYIRVRKCKYLNSSLYKFKQNVSKYSVYIHSLFYTPILSPLNLSSVSICEYLWYIYLFMHYPFHVGTKMSFSCHTYTWLWRWKVFKLPRCHTPTWFCCLPIFILKEVEKCRPNQSPIFVPGISTV